MTSPLPHPLPLPLFPPRPDCTLCPLHTRCRSPGIALHLLPESLPPSIHTPAVLFIGQNPGFNEDRLATPFVGATGRFLRTIYIPGIHLTRLATIYVTNTARCYHRDGDGPAPSHYKACRSYLLPDLHTLSALHPSHPLLLITLGAPATTHTYALLGRPRVTLTSSFKHQLSRFPLPPLTPVSSKSDTPAPSPRARRSAKAAKTPPVNPGEGVPPDPVPRPPFSAPEGQLNATDGAVTSAGECSITGRSEHVPGREGGPGCLVVSTYHPAAVLRTRNLVYAVEGHLRLAMDHLTGHAPVPTTPTIVPFRFPRP